MNIPQEIFNQPTNYVTNLRTPHDLSDSELKAAILGESSATKKGGKPGVIGLPTSDAVPNSGPTPYLLDLIEEAELRLNIRDKINRTLAAL